MTIYLDGTPISVDDVYKQAGFTELPATPTMMGMLIRLRSGDPRPQEKYSLHKDETPLGPAIRDTEGVPLTDGMKFCLVPYASV